MYKCINNIISPQLISVTCFPKNAELLFSQREEKINAPKNKNWLPQTKLHLQLLRYLLTARKIYSEISHWTQLIYL